jgi:Heat induced stress protein YflT domain
MINRKELKMNKTIAAFFDDFEEAYDAMNDLVRNGFQRKDISLVANNVAGQVKDMKSVSGMSAMQIAGVGSSAVIGPLGAMVGNGFLSALSQMGLPHQEADVYAEGVRRGGALLALEVQDGDDKKAIRLINQHAPKDIESRAMTWREEGWEHFDSQAEPLDSEQLWPREKYREGAENEPTGEAQLYPRDKFREGEPGEEKELYPRDEYRSEEELAEADSERQIWPRR